MFVEFVVIFLLLNLLYFLLYNLFLFQYKNFVPTIDSSSYIHPQANVTGNVEIGKNVYVGPGAVLRGDWGKIVVENGCNIQENCVMK